MTSEQYPPTPDTLFPGLFEAVQLKEIFHDSKTFVDCRPKTTPEAIMEAFESGKGASDFDLKTFVLKYFELPKDYATNFTHDPSRSAIEHVEALWPYLSRPGIPTTTPGDSLIAIPNGYIVPGGRFGEIYYWDSYFTMLGLAKGGHIKWIEDMIDNFAYLIDTYGHIPNGNRTYFLSRSQPPFFAYMVKLLADQKGKHIWPEYMPYVEKEYRFWMFGERYIPQWGVNRYWDDNPIPRQESYKEEIELLSESGREATKLYRDIRAACESGWDFTSRWLADGQNLATIEASDIIPVDLNALLYGVEEMLRHYYQHMNRSSKSDAIEINQRRRHSFLQHYCWDEQAGIYRDYHVKHQEQTSISSLATVYPLFSGITTQHQADAIAKSLKNDFLKAGGLLTTLHHTGQQWDAPNGWAPLQWLAVKGLGDYGHHDLAREIAMRWTSLNESVYENTGKFVEKYNVVDTSLKAGGGEYPVQDGFGWSNGVYVAMKSYLSSE